LRRRAGWLGLATNACGFTVKIIHQKHQRKGAKFRKEAKVSRAEEGEYGSYSHYFHMKTNRCCPIALQKPMNWRDDYPVSVAAAAGEQP
jgi:hypothetical protein